MILSVMAILPVLIASVESEQQGFTVMNQSDLALQTIARVSLPIPVGLLADESTIKVRISGKVTASQTRVITKHPDGSVRRLMLSLPVELRPGETIRGVCELQSNAMPVSSMLKAHSPARITTGAYTLLATGDAIQLQDLKGRRICLITPFGPDPAEFVDPEVLDEGPHFVWLRWKTEGADRASEVDLQVDSFGQIKLTHRLQRRLAGNAWTPDFGFKLSASEAEARASIKKPVHFMQFDPFSEFADHPELTPSLILADGTRVSVANPLALRQNRGTLETTVEKGKISIRSSRLEPVEDLEKAGLMIQEGQWRVSELLISPVSQEELASRIDHPINTHAHWRAYDAVYHTGPPLQVSDKRLNHAVEKYVHAMQMMSINGDDWGNMTNWAPQQKRTPINSFVRYNHCRYVWEDFFRTGDARLLAIARDWSENYRNLTVYWGPNEKYYGGGRRGRAYRDKPGSPHGPGTYMVRYDYVQGFVTKGFHSFWLAYEETGDPRFREAAEAQARWAAANIYCHKGEMRNVGAITDFVKLYEYTGRQLYLDSAVRLWEEFKSQQGDDLLFTQNGKPAVGDHLYIPNDQYGYKHPFVKPYIVQYATNALPGLLKHRPEDRRLRDTILALNNWMARVQTPGGGYGYPAPSTAGVGWPTEYDNGLMLAYGIELKEEYLVAVARDLRAVIQLLEIHGEIPSGINPWESIAGVNAGQRAKMYHLATDRDRNKDFTGGQVKFGQSPDRTVYFQVILRNYLKYRDEASLFESDKVLEQIKALPTTLE